MSSREGKWGSFEQRRLRAKMRFGFLLCLVVLAAGTMGCRFLEGRPWLECLYMTGITISTVGFKEVGEVGVITRLFTILLFFSGIGTVALIGSSLAGKSMAESRVRQSMGRMILAIKQKDGNMAFDPPPETVLRPGDVRVTIGRGKPAASGA